MNRKLHLDILRIIAILLVVMNHTGENGFVLFTTNREMPLYLVYLAHAHIVKIGVPLFFMVSGALLLGKQESIGELFRKRILRIVIILLGCSAVAFAIKIQVAFSPLILKEYFKEVLKCTVTSSYWYLYAYLTYLLCLPFLRKLVAVMSNADFGYMFLIYLVSRTALCVIAFIFGSDVPTYSEFYNPFVMLDYVLFPMLGYFIEERVKVSGRVFGYLVLAAILALILSMGATHYICSLMEYWAEAYCQNYLSALVAVPAAAVMIGVKRCMDGRSTGAACTGENCKGQIPSRVIVELSELTFGIYLFDYLYRQWTSPIYLRLIEVLPPLTTAWIWTVCACLLGAAVTVILRRMPLLSKLL